MGRHFVIGGSGLVGGELCRQLEAHGRAVIGTAHTQRASALVRYDLQRDALGVVAPDLGADDTVYLLAAATMPNWVARHPIEARALNVEATRACLGEALAGGARVVFASTEIVFDGEHGAGCREQDAVNPRTLYGRQKVEIEQWLAPQPGNWCVVRMGPLVARHGHAHGVIETTYETLLGPGAKMAHDNYFSVTSVEDAASAIIRLVEQDCRGVWHVAANPPISRCELADAIMLESRRGRKMGYRAVDFAALSFLEPRPRAAWLRNDKLVMATGMRFAATPDVIARRVAQLDTAPAAFAKTVSS